MTTSSTEIEETTETFEVTVTLSKPVYEIARLLCQFENDLDWNSYVSEIVKREVSTVKNGHCDAFMTYVNRKLKNEKW